MYKKLIFIITCCLVINSSYAMTVKEFNEQKQTKRTLVGIYLQGLYTGFTLTEFMMSSHLIHNEFSRGEFCHNNNVIYSEENFVQYLDMAIADERDPRFNCDNCPIEPVFYGKMRNVSECK